MTSYVVEIQPGCWLAPWGGDPGRTLVLNSARVFPSKRAARMALKRARVCRACTEARIVEVRVVLEVVNGQ